MRNNVLVQLACPGCTQPINIREQTQQIECPDCGNHLLLDGYVCPCCGQYHNEKSGICHVCSTPMTQTCTNCHSNNWAGAQTCQQCGTLLTIFERLQLCSKQGQQALQAAQNKQDQQLMFTAVFVLSVFVLIVTAFAFL